MAEGTPLLRRGARGDAVRRLQQALLGAGFDPGGVDGVFGPRTEGAVERFQAAKGLVTDGIVGPRTWAAILGTSARAPGHVIDWVAVGDGERMRYVMKRLVDRYGYPVNGAAGIVGNLSAESGVLPHRIEGSSAGTPMRARNFAGSVVDFTASQVMNRNQATRDGPALPGIGLAQWTSSGRRRGLFDHQHDGRRPGADILFDMDAQVDYLDHELQTEFTRVHGVVKDVAVTLHAASDEIVYNFEIPGAILADGTKLPRADPRVQNVFQRRRGHSERALLEFRVAQP
jgi:hypothetical protein